MKLVRSHVIFLDVKDQTEYFMEKGEIRKYIPFLKLYSSVSAFFIYSSRSNILSIKHTTTIHKLVC